MTRIGIAGMHGRQGKRWFRTVRDAEEGYGMFLSRSHDGSIFTPDVDEFVTGSDRIIIATPVDSHYDIAAAALRAGKPVLCEKPLAPTYQQAAQLYDLASRCWTRLWVCYPHLWHPVVEAMAKLGSGIDLEVTFVGPTEREPLLDWAPHALSTALYILGTDAQLATCALSKDRKRANVELVSGRGRAHCMFGLGAIKRVSVQTKNQPRHYYNGENCHPTTMQRMLTAWLAAENDPRGAPELTLGVHEILEEAIK